MFPYLSFICQIFFNVVDHLVGRSMIPSVVAHSASNMVDHPVGRSMMSSDVTHSASNVVDHLVGGSMMLGLIVPKFKRGGELTF